MASVWRKGRLPFAFGLLAACLAAAPATAQFFFRPFYQTWRYELPPEEEDLPRYASRRAVARIMARAGYELVGPLGRRGDQIVATGVSRRDGQARFFIDPYEGQVLHVTRLGPPAAAPEDRGAEQSRPPRTAPQPPAAEDGSRPARGKAAKLPAAPSGPVETAKPMEMGKAPEASKPDAIAKPPDRLAEPPKAEAARQTPAAEISGTREAKPVSVQPEASPPVAATQKTLPERPVAARSTGGGHRAIVPPKTTEGVTAVTPSAPAAATPATTGGKSPANVAMPKDAQ